MEKEQEQNDNFSDADKENNEMKNVNEIKSEMLKIKMKKKKLLLKKKLKELEDKLARTFAEMENQRRRFEKEKDDAFEYGGTSFAKEALKLIDNLERSKQILENDEKLKNTDALKKTLEHFDIIIKT